MNGCEFCGDQEAAYWTEINEKSHLFCSEHHGLQFENIAKALKFKAGWSKVEMLISKETPEGWICKAFRGMADLEFKVIFDEKSNIVEFSPIFDDPA